MPFISLRQHCQFCSLGFRWLWHFVRIQTCDLQMIGWELFCCVTQKRYFEFHMGRINTYSSVHLTLNTYKSLWKIPGFWSNGSSPLALWLVSGLNACDWTSTIKRVSISIVQSTEILCKSSSGPCYTSSWPLIYRWWPVLWLLTQITIHCTIQHVTRACNVLSDTSHWTLPVASLKMVGLNTQD